MHATLIRQLQRRQRPLAHPQIGVSGAGPDGRQRRSHPSAPGSLRSLLPPGHARTCRASASRSTSRAERDEIDAM
jgi:hypothetical protein